MKILISVQYFYPPVGGAEQSLISLAQELAKSHDVFVLKPGKYTEFVEIGKIRLLTQKVPFFYKPIWYDIVDTPSFLFHFSPILFQAKYWKQVLERKINKIKPDLILTQLNFSAPSIDIAVENSIPSIVFIRSYEHFCPIGFINGTNCSGQCNNCISLHNKIHYLYLDKWMKWNIDIIKKANLVVANSRFIANLVTKKCNVDPIIFYPSVDSKKYLIEFNLKEYVTIINLTNLKGADIFFKIAKSLPTKKFLVVGGDRHLLNSLRKSNFGNVTIIEKTSNMQDIYSKTRILLFPAKWPEPFGRVVIEAGVSGIPTIASNRGGLPEAVGTGGIVIDDIYDINKWVNAINSLDDLSLYNQLSENAKENSSMYSLDFYFENFLKEVYLKSGIKL